MAVTFARKFVPGIRSLEVSDLDEFQPRTSIVNYNNDDWNNLSVKVHELIYKISSKKNKYKGLKRNINQNKKEQSSCRE